MLTLTVEGRLVLTPTSVLPPAAALPTPWHEVEIGGLAVPVGQSTPDGNVRPAAVAGVTQGMQQG